MWLDLSSINKCRFWFILWPFQSKHAMFWKWILDEERHLDAFDKEIESIRELWSNKSDQKLMNVQN
jgi:hypothetical protein